MATLHVKRLHSILDKSVGLISKKKAAPIIFTTRFGIHTFGLSFPIDVVILDKKNRVVGLKKSLQKNKVFLWNPKFNTVIELPEGEIDKVNIRLGDQVVVKEITD